MLVVISQGSVSESEKNLSKLRVRIYASFIGHALIGHALTCSLEISLLNCPVQVRRDIREKNKRNQLHWYGTLTWNLPAEFSCTSKAPSPPSRWGRRLPLFKQKTKRSVKKKKNSTPNHMIIILRCFRMSDNYWAERLRRAYAATHTFTHTRSLPPWGMTAYEFRYVDWFIYISILI